MKLEMIKLMERVGVVATCVSSVMAAGKLWDSNLVNMNMKAIIGIVVAGVIIKLVGEYARSAKIEKMSRILGQDLSNANAATLMRAEREYRFYLSGYEDIR